MATESQSQPMPDPNALAEAVMNVAEKSAAHLRTRLAEHGVDLDAEPDPFGLLPAFLELTASWAR